MSSTKDIHVGDVVRFHFGRTKVTGVVKEDRGPIGVKGRRLYLIDFSTEPDEAAWIELPAELLEQPPTWAVLNLRSNGPMIEQSHNIMGVTEHGTGPHHGFDLTMMFDENFSDDLYSCQVSANRDVSYQVLHKTPRCVRFVINGPVPDRVKIVCSEL
jgi:hypothetical protein